MVVALGDACSAEAAYGPLCAVTPATTTVVASCAITRLWYAPCDTLPAAAAHSSCAFTGATASIVTAVGAVTIRTTFTIAVDAHLAIIANITDLAADAAAIPANTITALGAIGRGNALGTLVT